MVCVFPETSWVFYIQEFVQSEIDREAAAIANDRERARQAEDRTAGVDDKLKRLREQVSTLQEGVSQVTLFIVFAALVCKCDFVFSD